MPEKQDVQLYNSGKPFTTAKLGFKLEGPLPPGAIPLPKEDIIRIQERAIYKYQPKPDMYPLRFGFAAIGVATGLCGLALNQHFRKLIVLEDRFLYRNMLMASAIPGYFSAIAHLKLVQQPIQLKPAGCKLCLQLRSALVTGAFGMILPATLGLMTTTLSADMEGYYKFERNHYPTYARDFARATWKNARLSVNLAIASFCVMFVVGQIVAFFEIEAAEKLNNKLFSSSQML